MKAFNTTGSCRPSQHYMVDIAERMGIIRKMISRGDYFCINRGRQYGKTTTLEAISRMLSDDFCIFRTSFEGLSDSCFAEEESLFAMVAYLLAETFAWVPLKNLDKEVEAEITAFTAAHHDKCSEKELSKFISTICHRNSKPIVVIIDEVDQASNHSSFLKLLSIFRRMYLGRDVAPTFQSVILAGVYDIKNLKLKLRPEEYHQYNSPWNIAAPFDIDMSLSAEGIADMLTEYKTDHKMAFDEVRIAQMIRDYTSGYPFLVSRVCQILDEQALTWDRDGVLKAFNIILMERNTLFDNMIKKLDEYPELKETLKRILLEGVSEIYNPDEKSLQIASMLSYIVNRDGHVAVACRIMETRLYNFFLAEKKTSKTFLQGQVDKSLFIDNGKIDMQHLLERFAVHVNETFRMDKQHQFLEENGREIFLTYLRPIINGVGNYYIEAQTRTNDRMDVIVDYLGTQYVIELKIWRGETYNKKGEEQLCRYLDKMNAQTGYLLSFCFNKKKESGIQPPVTMNGRTLIEVII